MIIRKWFAGIMAMALLGSVTQAATQTLDYAVAAAPGGINLYAITNKGVTLVPGSPFVANNPAPPIDIYTGQPAVSPVLLSMDSSHQYVYAVYPADTTTQSMIAGWKITRKGLVQQFGTVTTVYENGNHANRPTGISISDGFETVYYAGASGSFGSIAEIYDPRGVLKGQYSGALLSPPYRQGLENVVIDPTGQSLFACFLSAPGTGPSVMSVDIFNIKSGKLLAIDTDPISVDGICAQ